jgi:hypothetical protein
MAAERRGPAALRYIFSWDVFKRNSLLAIVVGCLLTMTNQLDVLLTQPFTLRLGAKTILNFLIPFVVSSAGAAMNRRCT